MGSGQVRSGQIKSGQDRKLVWDEPTVYRKLPTRDKDQTPSGSLVCQAREGEGGIVARSNHLGAVGKGKRKLGSVVRVPGDPTLIK